MVFGADDVAYILAAVMLLAELAAKFAAMKAFTKIEEHFRKNPDKLQDLKKGFDKMWKHVRL